VRDILAPTLRPGQTVVLDNLSCHADAAARRLIEERGCCLLPLPAYSPDFSPIELAFAKVKQYLRRAALKAALARRHRHGHTPGCPRVLPPLRLPLLGPSIMKCAVFGGKAVPRLWLKDCAVGQALHRKIMGLISHDHSGHATSIRILPPVYR